MTDSIQAVRDVFRKFQEGYARRDPATLDEFMELFIPGEELEVVGTNALEVGQGEWCLGREAARRLVSNDWQYWGDVRYDVDGAHIFALGDAAWLATTGTVTDTIPVSDRYAGYLEYVQSVLAEEGDSAQDKVLDIVRLGSDIVLALPLSENFTWPFRFTAILVRQAGEWRFHQMHFSFPTTRSPDVRLK
jgi:hypothetical protein